MKVRNSTSDDAAEIAYIYNHYIATSHVTFETEPVSGDEMKQRMMDLTADGYPFLVIEDAGELLAYTYAHPFRERAAYRHLAEVSIYVRPGALESGIGSELYSVLIERLREGGFHSVIAGISLPNEASIGLHEKFGFKKAGHLVHAGSKFDRWIDVGLWQLLLDK